MVLSRGIMTDLANTPLRPQPVFLKKPWGGHYFSEMYPGLAPEGTGEAWVASNLSGELGTTVHGIPLGQLGCSVLPLVKLIDSSRTLSVQLHPNDAMARAIHGPGHRGKTEAWYFLRAPAEGFVYLGMEEGVLPKDLLDCVRAGKNPEHFLRQVQVEQGDCLVVEPGTIHSLTQGAVVAEVQSPSDLTYRIYDWGRLGLDGKPRELHFEWSERMLRTPILAPSPKKPSALKHTPGRYSISPEGPLGFDILKTREAPVSIDREETSQAIVLVNVEGKSEVRSAKGAWPPEELQRGACLVLPPGSGNVLVGGEGECALGYLRR